MVFARPDDERLDNPLFADRFSEFLETLRSKVFPRLERAGPDLGQRDFADGLEARARNRTWSGCRCRGRSAEKRAQAAA